MTAPALLLAADAVELYAPGDLDAHGWRTPDQPPPPPVTGWETLVAVPPRTDPYAWVMQALDCVPAGPPVGAYQFGYGLWNPQGGMPPPSATCTVYQNFGQEVAAGDLGIATVFCDGPLCAYTCTDDAGNTWTEAPPAIGPAFAQHTFTAPMPAGLGHDSIVYLTATPAPPGGAVAAVFGVAGVTYRAAVADAGNTTTAQVTVPHTDPAVVIVAIPGTGVDQAMGWPDGWNQFGRNNTGLGCNTLSWQAFEQPAGRDAAPPYWAGIGNLQEQPAFSDPRMNGGGGAGPFQPHRTEACRLYLPPDAQPREGSPALIRGRWWVLSTVRLVPDPTAPPAGGITCWTATATSTAQWVEV